MVHILSYLGSFPAYKIVPAFLRRWNTALVKVLKPWKDNIRIMSVIFDAKVRTIARWKSGLFPLEVLASNVNCETQSISPSISFTLDFHIFSGLLGSEKTRRERLRIGPKMDVRSSVQLTAFVERKEEWLNAGVRWKRWRIRVDDEAKINLNGYWHFVGQR
jgi:hypothetical protein